MSRYRYHQQFSLLMTNSLLHLLSHIAADTHYWPRKKRNELLVRYLKKQLKSPQFDKIKKDIKTMLAVAKRGGALENKLYELDSLNKQYEQKFTQADTLFILLTYLYDEQGFESQLERGQAVEPNIIYMTQEDIDDCFDENNQLIKPLTLTIKMEKPLFLIDMINHHGRFVAKLTQIDEHQIAHILLDIADEQKDHLNAS